MVDECDIICDTSGYSTGSFAVQERGSNGYLLAEWRGLGDYLSGIAIGGRGNVFVGTTRPGKIIKLSPAGRELSTWDCAHVTESSALVTDRRGNLYVTDGDTDVVAKLSFTGRELAVWDGSSGGRYQ